MDQQSLLATKCNCMYGLALLSYTTGEQHTVHRAANCFSVRDLTSSALVDCLLPPNEMVTTGWLLLSMSSKGQRAHHLDSPDHTNITECGVGMSAVGKINLPQMKSNHAATEFLVCL